MSAHQFRGGLGLFGDLGIELIPRDHHTFVTALADHVHAVMCTHFENHLAATHLNALHIALHDKTGRGGRRVAYVDVGAEAAFASVEVLFEQLHTRPLHQHD